MPRVSSRRLIACLLVVLSAGVADAQRQVPNTGFESLTANGAPAGWLVFGEGFQITTDSVERLEGRFSLRTRWTDAAAFSSTSGRFALVRQSFPLALVAGRRLRVSGFIRTENIQTGYAGFWIRADGPGGMLGLENMMSRGPRGTTPWTRYDVELPVDSGATSVVFGALHPGNGTAWFDSLSVEVVGDPMPRMVASFRPATRPAENMTRLLTDAEMALPADSVTISENPAFEAWVKAHARPVRSLGATDFSDLRFFAPLLANKRIVQLGESGHGVAEFNMAKVRLIKYLHQELGYDVIAFESSVFECNRAQRIVDSLSAAELMRACIFGVWHTAEALPLFEYIKETQKTSRPLILAGFDAQTSSALARSRPAVFHSLIAPIDSSYARRVLETDSEFLANRSQDGYVAANQARFVAFYDSLATWFRVNHQAIQANWRDQEVVLVARQAAISMTFFVRQLATGPSIAGTEIRDLGMANNLDFLLDSLYRGKKVIVWAHNFHIQHRENTRNVTDRQLASTRTMGTWVAERRRSEVYTIGLFMYRGSATMNDRRPYQIVQSRSGSLESILHRAPWKYTFVDFSKARREPGTEWMWSPINSFSWGNQIERIVPRDEYDGVLFIDTVHPPRYR